MRSEINEVYLFNVTTYLLGKISLDCVMRISIEGTDIKDFDFPSMESKWLEIKSLTEIFYKR